MADILIVDDEAELASLVEYNLRQAGFATRVALTGEQALAFAAREAPALVVLDLMLPDVAGTEVCRRLRAEPRTRDVPILMLTARGEEHERVAGFEAGADDYVVKPFSPRELVLRVKAMLRRAPAAAGAQRLSVGGLALDVAAHRAFVGDDEVELTALEFRLLHHFLTHPGRVQSRERLLAEVWGITRPQETRTVDTHVLRLRDKLGRLRDVIETVRGVGYRLATPAAP